MLVATAVAQSPCDCLGDEANGLPPATFFTEAGYPGDYGSSCQVWDLEDPSCQEGEANFGVDWCTEPWCYVGAECETAYDTVFFAETEYKDTLKFDVITACASTEEGSAALYASAVAMTVAAVAVSL